MPASFALLCIAATVSSAQTFTTIANFANTSVGAPQYSTLVQGTDGALYGTTDALEAGPGTVFRIGTDGALSLLYSFCSLPKCADGETPFSGVIVGSHGNLYGATYLGGAYDEGSVFELTLGGSLKTLYSFCIQRPCIDGSGPIGGLTQGTDGNLYGTTSSGGVYGDGTVFRLTPAGVLTVLHSFCVDGFPCSDGFSPQAALTEGSDGNFYGSTFGGLQSFDLSAGSTLFKVNPSGTFSTLWNFSEGFNENGGPLAPLLPLGNGAFYGTITGSPNGNGTIFRVKSDGSLRDLYNFCSEKNCSDGHYPSGTLELGTDASLYGTTGLGGNTNCVSGCGTIFQAQKGKFTTLYSFCPQSGCSDGYEPLGGLVQATNGVFYGTTYLGGLHQAGTVFSLDMGLGPFVRFIIPAARIGHMSGILGQGFTGTISVSLNGVPMSFTVVSDTFLEATIPAGATSGYVIVTTPNGTLTSNVPFHVIP